MVTSVAAALVADVREEAAEPSGTDDAAEDVKVEDTPSEILLILRRRDVDNREIVGATKNSEIFLEGWPAWLGAAKLAAKPWPLAASGTGTIREV